jgi:hypothetical protein
MQNQSDFSRRRQEVQEKYEPVLQAADTTRQERKDLLEQMQIELQKITEDENRTIDSRLFSRAKRLDIDRPSLAENELWEDTGKAPFLSPKGRLALRRAIDEEKTRRRDVAAWWWKRVIIPGLAAATGLIGSLTGLFAVLHRK